MDDISKEDVPKLLDELQAQGFIKVYSTSRTKAIQMLNWWSVQKLQCAWPSEYPPPDGWLDRLRYKKGKKQVITENWDSGESSPESSGDVSGSPESSPEPSQASERGKVNNQELIIKNQELISPENSGERSPPEGGHSKGLFENLLEQIKSAPNRKEAIARVGELYQVCAGRAPPYGRIGVIARKVNYDSGYLAKLIWETAAKRPAGDLLDYVEGILRSSDEGVKDKRIRGARPPSDFSGGEW
jgi:hypothetical protein